ncbi:MAG: hypothetical protein IJR08_05690 [Bacilli bacterium]|nr:hypothetical protein [Bacilli bacterium]
MKKRKNLSYEQKLIDALKKLPNPLEDKKHNILIFCDNSRARSNQSRFEHIVDSKHKLLVSDIERIARCINASKLKKDRNRKDTFNLYIKRNTYNKEYIKISLRIDAENQNIAYVKTIFITKIKKW